MGQLWGMLNSLGSSTIINININTNSILGINSSLRITIISLRIIIINLGIIKKEFWDNYHQLFCRILLILTWEFNRTLNPGLFLSLFSLSEYLLRMFFLGLFLGSFIFSTPGLLLKSRLSFKLTL